MIKNEFESFLSNQLFTKNSIRRKTDLNSIQININGSKQHQTFKLNSARFV